MLVFLKAELNNTPQHPDKLGEQMAFEIVNAAKVGAVDLKQINSLLAQLSSKSDPLTLGQYEEVVTSEAATLLLALQSIRVIGILTLVTFPLPTGRRAWVEDVVVDESFRGRGVASLLMKAAVGEARGRGAKTLDLTSRPERRAANQLYQKLGFVRRDTNVYRFQLEE
jgi:ribosomal protein S18 acetylase RimI-like enzyme